MKKTILSFGFAAVLLFSATAQSLTIKGSDTCLPLIQKEAESYMKSNTATSITVTGGGSGVGLAALMNGTTDIAMSSRPMKMDEKLKMQDAGKGDYKTTTFAYDALSVVVNPGNSVTQLTRQQLEDIFTGKTTNWKTVGGPDMAIVVYTRESSSGTYEFFKEKVLKNKNFAATALSMPATGSIIQSVGQTKGAIGYVGMAYVNSTVKALGVSFDGTTYVKPSLATAMNKTYPIVRPLYLYYLSTTATKAKGFTDYILSTAGQSIVQTVGYIPIADVK